MFENIFLAVVFIVSAYYIYKKLKPSSGCGCGDSDCCDGGKK
ncbi:MAG: FeoB-associated Cys-rich membrane protein [Campylobacterales bacterium]